MKPEARSRADLHIHTHASDGRYSPAEVVRMAAELGLGAIAIADHDTVDGIEEALTEADAVGGIRIVPAVEINTDHGESEVHILGYFVDFRDEGFRSFLAGQRDSRSTRAAAIVKRLRDLGMPIDFERVKDIARGAIGRPHIALALTEKGFASSVDDAMDRLLSRGRPAYVPRNKLTPVAAVRAVVEAAGVPVFAHPGTAGCDGLIEDLVKAGLGGLEAYHPQHDAAAQRRYAAMARARGLVATGGSDFHGPQWAGNVGIGGVWVPVHTVSLLLERLTA